MTELRTERLRLRAASPADAAALHRVFTDPEAMRYWSRPPHRALEETTRWLRSMLDSEANGVTDFVVEYEGEVIGKAGCWRLPEVGFILARPFWRRGFAHEALRAVIARVFADHPVEALEADVDPRNEACLGLLRKLGFEETGRAERTYRVGDEWVDSVYLRLARPAAG